MILMGEMKEPTMVHLKGILKERKSLMESKMA